MCAVMAKRVRRSVLPGVRLLRRRSSAGGGGGGLEALLQTPTHRRYFWCEGSLWHAPI